MPAIARWSRRSGWRWRGWSRQAQLVAALQPDQQPRRAVARGRALLERLQPPRGHQVDQQRQLPVTPGGGEMHHRHLPDAPYSGDRPPLQRVQRRVEGLQRVHPRRQRGLDPDAVQGGVEAARGDLDLG